MAAVVSRRGCVRCTAILLALASAACGRLGFDPSSTVDPGGDAAGSGDDAALPDDGEGGDGGELPLGPVIPIATDAESSRAPTLIAVPGGFAVIFDQSAGNDRELYLARTDDQGTLMGTPAPITASQGSSSFASALWDGTNIAVAWEELQAGKSNVRFGRFMLDGTPVSEVQLSNAVKLAYDAALVRTSTGFSVSWDDGKIQTSDVWVARVDGGGAAVGSPQQLTNNTGISYRSSIAWNGSEHALVWEDNVSGDYEAYFSRVSAAGQLIGAIAPLTNMGGSVYNVKIAWNGSDYGVAFADNRSGTYAMYFQRVSATGATVGDPVMISPTGAGDARCTEMVWTGARFVVAWAQDNLVYIAELASDGSVLVAPREVGEASDLDDTALALVSTPAAHAIAWQNMRSGTYDVFLRVIPR